MSHFFIKEASNLSEDDLRLMGIAWEKFEEKHGSQTSESLLLVKSLVKVAFVQGYSSAKANEIPPEVGNIIPYVKED